MKKILAIDDQRDNLISIKGFLKNFLPNCKLFLADSGKEGIAIAQKEQPDTILLDIIMPEMDGFEVCKVLKQDARTKFIPILMLSALGQDTESRVKGLELGADAFLAKPFIPLELKAQINVMLRIKEAEDKLRKEKGVLEETVLDRTYKLKESEEKYKALYDNAPLPYQSLDENGVFVDVNPAWLSKLGYKLNEVLGKKFSDFLHTERKPYFEKKFSELIKSGYVHDVYYKIRHKDGQYRDIMFEGCTGTHPDGSFKQTYCVFQDVTERKWVEQALKESERRTTTLINNLQGIAYRCRNDKDWTMEFISKGIFDIAGYNPEDIIDNKKLSFNDFIIPEDRERVWKDIQSAVKKRESFEINYRIKTASGEIKYLLEKGNGVFDNETGEFLALEGFVNDVTKSKVAAEALKSSEEMYKNIFNNSPLGILHFNTEGVITDCNDEFVGILGSTKEKLVGLNMIKQLKDKKIIKAIEDTLVNGSAYFNDYYSSVTGEKTTPVVIHFKAIYDLKDEIVGGVGMVEDITERKLAEEALKASEELNRSITQSAADAIISMDQNGIILSWNAAAEKIFDYSSKEMTNSDLSLIIPEKYQNGHNSGVQRLKEGGKEKIIGGTIEITAVRKGGKEFPIELSLSSWETDNQKYFTGIIRDITERKRAENLLSEQQQSLTGIIEGTNAGTWDWNILTGDLKLNERWSEIMGYTLEELEPIDVNTWINNVHPDDLPVANALLEKVFKKELDYYDVIFRQPHKGGGDVWVNARGKIVEWTDDGKPIRMSGIHTDITKRKKAEEEQIRSEKRFRRLFDGLGDAVFVTRIGGKDKGRILEVNTAALTQTGYSREELLQMNIINDLSVIGSGELSAGDWEEKLLKGETVTTTEKKKRKDSTEFWTEMIVTQIDFKGEKASLSINHDITNRILANKALKESEEKYRELIDTTSEGFWLLNTELRTVDVNKSLCNMLGYNKEEIVGKSPLDFVDDENKIVFKNQTSRITSTLHRNYDIFFTRKNGTKFPAYLSATSIVGEDGNTTGSFAFVSDFTERKKAEENIFKFSRLFEDAYNEIFLFDVDSLKFTQVNKAGIHNLGYSLSELQQMTPIDIKPEYNEEKFKETIEPMLNGTIERLEFQTIHARKDKSTYFVEVNLQLVEFEGLRFFAAIIMDITRRKESETKIKNALEKATESERLKSAFLATISHELRTPLNAIIGFSDLINSDWPLEEIYGFAKTINESGAHLLSIVEEIFDITLIETGETTINNKDENLHLALRSVSKVIESEQRKLEKEDLELNLIIPDSDASLTINTDIAKFKQILLNLLKNALKFTHKGHINYGYSFIEHDDKKMLRFYVEDTGIGVPLDKQELIFITFRQVEESLNRTYGGTGIGLSISKKLTELLGGTLWIESEEGVGSTFYFTIPLEGVDNSRIQYDINFDTEIVSDKGDIISTKTFLIVEDDDTSYEFLQIVLEKPGTNILWAKNGKEAVKLCKEIPEINLVLMDINMQVMDGYKATREIKKLRPELPIIAQTAFAIAGDREKVLKAGCDDYISKPIVIEELMKKIEKWI